MESKNTVNPITLMRGDREQEQFAAEVNARLGYKATSVFGIARLESREYARNHKTKIATLAPLAQYNGQGVQELYDEYQAWVRCLDQKDLIKDITLVSMGRSSGATLT